MQFVKIFCVFSLLFFTHVVTSNAKTSEPIRENRKIEQKERISAVKREKILNFSNKMTIRLEATVERIEKLITRIETRVKKIETDSKNINVEEAKESLDRAKQKLVLIKIEINTLKNDVLKMVESDSPKAVFEKVKTSLDKIKEGLKEVHQLLVKIIGDIKGLRSTR